MQREEFKSAYIGDNQHPILDQSGYGIMEDLVDSLTRL